MRNCRILLTRSLLETDKSYIEEGLYHKVGNRFEIFEPDSFDEEGILKKISFADVLLGPFVTEKLIKKANNVKLIQVPWSGMDTFNFKVLENCNIPVCNSHSNSQAVAEFGIGLTLDLLKKISFHDRKMRSGSWNREQNPLNLKSSMISNQRVCVLGYGQIGRKIGKILNAFGAKIIAVANHKINYEEVTDFYLASDWTKAIVNADVIIITLPLTHETKGLINRDTLKVFKKGSKVVNISRAGIIDEDSMYEALLNGDITGFASDVWWNSPKRGESNSYVSTHNKFESLEHVILSPHRAGFIEHNLPHLDDAIENIAKLINEEPLINVVNINKEY